MKEQFITASLLMLAIISAGADTMGTRSRTAAPGPGVAGLRPANVTRATTESELGLAWYEVDDSILEGRGWKDTDGLFRRLPTRAKGKVTPSVLNLSRHTAGLCLHFVTDSPTVGAVWDGTEFRMSHMAETGSGGLDLYRKDGQQWNYCGTGKPSKKRSVCKIAGGLPSEPREYLLYLPLYHDLTEFKLGLAPKAIVALPPKRPATRTKPIVFYGTSITQGGCASRSGMCHTAIIGRRLGYEVINLGFSGAGKMEPIMGELLAELDPAVYVLETLPNMAPPLVKERYEPFVKNLRAAKPETPILLVENPLWSNEQNRIVRDIFSKLQAQGAKKLYLLPAKGQLDGDENATVDGVHPTDLGFLRMANAYTPVLKEILGE